MNPKIRMTKNQKRIQKNSHVVRNWDFSFCQMACVTGSAFVYGVPNSIRKFNNSTKNKKSWENDLTSRNSSFSSREWRHISRSSWKKWRSIPRNCLRSVLILTKCTENTWNLWWQQTLKRKIQEKRICLRKVKSAIWQMRRSKFQRWKKFLKGKVWICQKLCRWPLSNRKEIKQ